MTEREMPQSADPYLLTPEYWEGHGVEDQCAWQREFPTPKQSPRLDVSARQALISFFKSSDRNPDALRTFKKGELFDASNFNPGTIIRFETERAYLNPEPSEHNLPPYDRTSYWGVVVHYEEAGKQKSTIIRYYICESAPMDALSVGCGIIHSEKIRLGEIDHRRIGEAQRTKETLHRVDALTLYHIGNRPKIYKGKRIPHPSLKAAPQFNPATS